MSQSVRKLEAYDGTEVEITPLKQLSGGGTRIEVNATDGPRWRLDVTNSENTTVVTTWNADNELADVDLPDWMDDVVARLQHA